MATFNGTNNDDVFSGVNNSGNDIFNGFGGNDVLTGGEGRDTLNGGGGNDRFVITAQSELVAGEIYRGGAGLDVLDIDTGDILDLSGVTIDVSTERLEANAGIILTAAQLGNFTYVSTGSGAIELAGGGVADLTDASVFTTMFNLSAAGNTLDLTDVANGFIVNGGAGADVVFGADFNDTLNGLGGTDSLEGGPGDDSLLGGAGRDTLDGGFGNDRLTITDQTEIVAGESYGGGFGNDTLFLDTTDAINLVSLVIESDIENLQSGGLVTLNATQLGNFVNIIAAGLTLSGAGEADLTGAQVSAPTINLSSAGNSLILNDVFGNFSITGGAAADLVVGSDSGDVIRGAGGNDSLDGGAGADDIGGSTGVDTVRGGSGDDRLFISSQSDLVPGDIFEGGTGYDKLDLQTTALTNLSAVTLDGDIEWLESDGAVWLTPAQLGGFAEVRTQGAITLTSAGEADLSGAAVSTAVFNLHAGGNTLRFSGVTSASVTVIGAGGNDVAFGSLTGDTVLGGAGNDSLEGDGGMDWLTGGTGVDSVSGGAGDDRLLITAPGDVVAGEIYSGGDGSFDVLDIETGSTVNLSAVSIAGDIENLESGGIVLLTAAQAGLFNQIFAGTLTLTTAGLADLTGTVLSLTSGVINLNAGGNVLRLTDVFSGSYTINGNIGADTVYGAEFDDILRGGAGSDSLFGGHGSDVLTGGTGVDHVFGESGNDRLVINSQSELSAGEEFRGGIGSDVLDIATTSTINLSSVTIGQDLEALESDGALLLLPGQLSGFTSINTGAITFTGTGTADLTGNGVSTGTFNLSSAGNTLLLTGAAWNSYTVNGHAVSGADVVFGGELSDTILGRAGNDTLNGGRGDDVLTGGVGIDNVNGGGGNDRLVITAQTDIASTAGLKELYLGGSGMDVLETTPSTAINLTTVNIGADVEQLVSNGQVTLTPQQLGSFTNVSAASGGASIVLAGAGVADLTGATVFADAFTLASAGITLNLSDVISDSFTVNGSSASDIMIGGESSDSLNGNNGNDAITGRAGYDTMSGGAGIDTFNYTATAFNALDVEAGVFDTINSATGDRVNFTPTLESVLRTNGTSLGALSTNQVIGNTFSAGSNIRFVGGDTDALQLDLNGDQAFDFNDFSILVPGVNTVTYNAALDLFAFA